MVGGGEIKVMVMSIPQQLSHITPFRDIKLTFADEVSLRCDLSLVCLSVACGNMCGLVW